MDWNNISVRVLEGSSIREFVESCSDDLGGRVLDYGAGKQPYRDIVEAAGGDYHPFDRASFPANVSGDDVGGELHADDRFDAILCNQIVQYVPLYGPPFPGEGYPSLPLLHLLAGLFHHLGGNDGDPDVSGALVLTYPTSWAIVEPQDLCRFTPAGMDSILGAAGFQVERHDLRAELDLGGFRLPLGYGVLARA